jgi:hypothetical protein
MLKVRQENSMSGPAATHSLLADAALIFVLFFAGGYRVITFLVSTRLT